MSSLDDARPLRLVLAAVAAAVAFAALVLGLAERKETE
jgi:hypothetical protein